MHCHGAVKHTKIPNAFCIEILALVIIIIHGYVLKNLQIILYHKETLMAVMYLCGY